MSPWLCPQPCIPQLLALWSLELCGSVSGWMEQMEREEQQQGLFLLWGSLPVSGAQFLLLLSLALPFSLLLERKKRAARGQGRQNGFCSAPLPLPSSSTAAPGC